MRDFSASAVFFITFLLSCKISFAIDLALIEPHTLNSTLSQWVILDARPKTEWRAGHIPGAISFSWQQYPRTDKYGVPYRVWTPQELAKALGEIGIDEKTPVVVYGDADKSWGGEGWTCWVLSWLGHQGPIRLLNGGIQSWRYHKLPLNYKENNNVIRTVTYIINIKPILNITIEEIYERQKSNIVLIDTRSFFEWIKGHIPGAIRIDWSDFYSGKERRPISPDEFKNLLKKKGVDPNKQIVYYCTGGMRSGYAWMVHQLSGLPSAKNYEGGIEEWERFSLKY